MNCQYLGCQKKAEKGKLLCAGHRAELGSEAVVGVVDGQPVLDDPVAEAVMGVADEYNRSVAKTWCAETLRLNADRVAHFKGRAGDRRDVVIVLLCVNDAYGAVLADALMPGHDWQADRDRGETPFARGLAGLDGIVRALEVYDREAADKLRALGGLGVVVVNFGVAEVYPA